MTFNLALFIFVLLYWYITTYFFRLYIKHNLNRLTFTFKGNPKFFEKFLFIKLYKDHLPAKAEFDKSKVNSLDHNYLDTFYLEVKRGFIIHLVPVLFVIPLFFISYKYAIISLILYIIINFPFVVVLYYNGLKLQKILLLTAHRR